MLKSLSLYIFFGTSIGGLGLSLSRYFADLIFFPFVMNDGLYFLGYFVPIISGVILGGVLGYAMAKSRQKKLETAAIVLGLPSAMLSSLFISLSWSYIDYIGPQLPTNKGLMWEASIYVLPLPYAILALLYAVKLYISSSRSYDE